MQILKYQRMCEDDEDLSDNGKNRFILSGYGHSLSPYKYILDRVSGTYPVLGPTMRS